MKCPECEGKVVNEPRRGELMCEECGLIISELDMKNPSQRGDSYQERVSQSHHGTPYNSSSLPFHIKHELSTGFTPKFDDKDMKRLSQVHNRQMIYKDKRIKEDANIIMQIASKLDIPKPLRDDMLKYYSSIFEERLSIGRMKEIVIAGTIYLVARKESIPVVVDELASIVGCCPKQISRFYNELKRELGITVPLQRPWQYIEKYCSRLSINEKHHGEIKKLAKEMENHCTGKKANGVAGGCIYYYAENHEDIHHKTMEDVADACEVSQTVIRQNHSKIREVKQGR